ncbi:OsmC family protein [Sphingomonas tabacisoli]|uniref:OsmC family protein n=1 Tax=Sphingomonas tabacisoli TaxID=2249466 RepID=A0ABW4I3A6_9SPHN
MAQDQNLDRGAIARWAGPGPFQARIEVRGVEIPADEPVEVGGNGTGPTPYELLSAALATCTLMTLRLYASRKGWELPPFTVEVTHEIVPDGAGGRPRDLFRRHIAFEGALDPARHGKLLEIAEKCPVHRTLMRGFEIRTELGEPAAHPKGELATRHERDMERACAE